MIIWIVMAIVLVVMVTGGFVGRSRQARARQEAAHNGTHPGAHHDRRHRRSRGRGRGR